MNKQLIRVVSRNNILAPQVRHIPQPLHIPLSTKPPQAYLAGEELLHGGLFEVALLGDELVQRADQRIHSPSASAMARCSARRDSQAHGPELSQIESGTELPML